MMWNRKRTRLLLASAALSLFVVIVANVFPSSPFGATSSASAIPPVQVAQAASDVESACGDRPSSPRHFQIQGNAETVHWGFFSKTLPPVLNVQPKDFVTMDLITHHAGDDYERMIKGDPGIESIYHWTETEQTVSNRGPGVHVLTGPVYVCGAEPGDLLEVRILDLKPKPSGNPLYAGKTFGSNA
ncbi:MAG: acetamidase/formamidase family protein, partial [Synechococcales bacterium]|nr:acetamidase/formamidase family protein [Synechococcales bacterium]